MKRVLAILVALMVCACSVSALAERTSVSMKEIILDDKLCIEIPTDWTWMDLPEDLAEDGYLLIGVDDLNEMVACYRVIDRDVNMDIGDWATELIEEDENIAEVTLKVNPNGLYVLEYITEDQRVAGCLTIVDENTALSFDCRYADVTKTLEETCWPKKIHPPEYRVSHSSESGNLFWGYRNIFSVKMTVLNQWLKTILSRDVCSL